LTTSSSNPKQRIVRWLGLLLLIGMGVCPPWKMTYRTDDETVSSSLGYHPIWNPPSEIYEVPEDATESRHQVNMLQVGIQLAVVLILINVGNYAFRTRAT